MTSNCDWRFISNQNSTINGINDAGIETFTANIVHSLIRETIQNSLDAQLDKSKPVTVEYNEFKLDAESFPDNKNYISVLKKCLDSNKDEEDAKEFFTSALSKFEAPIRIMRVSDYNTMGLLGADKCEKGSAWSRLVKESGSSNKGQTSGGSFGIGKSAAYACSDLRTIFYSSLDRDGIPSNVGVARLVSFQDESLGGWTTGIGYYSNDSKLTAIREQADFCQEYNRTESGTDIYIMGFAKLENLDNEIITAILKNFLVSIWKQKLIVKVSDKVIDKSTMNHYVNQLNPYEGKQIKEIVDYYNLLTSSNPDIIKISLDNKEYGKSFGFESGECTLYLMEGNNLNSRIMMTRSAGMRLFDQGKISGTIDFTGILMIDGKNMNQSFRKMEVPSHDAWEPGRCKGETKLANKMYSELRRYLREMVKDNFASASGEQMDAFGASDFLPDKINKLDGEKGIVKEKLMNQIIKVLGKEMKPKKKTSRKVEIEVSPEPVEFPNSKRDNQKGEKRNKPLGDNLGDEKGFKLINIKERIICRDKNQGLYTIKYIVPNNAKRARLDFYINGEQSEYNFPVKEAVVKSGKANLQKIEDNKIYLDNIQRSDSISIDLKLDFNQYCLMEAEYHENKK